MQPSMDRHFKINKVLLGTATFSKYNKGKIAKKSVASMKK